MISPAVESTSNPTIAIIGAGASGTLVAARLLMHSRRRTILLFSSDGSSGRGVAYGTPWSGHLLNVPAGRMSAFPEEPDHFSRFFASIPPDGSTPREPGAPDAFAPRKLYGRYLQTLLDTAETRAYARGSRLLRRDQEVVALSEFPSHVEIGAADGETIAVDRVVLAIGNQHSALPAGWPVHRESRRLIADPWAPGALSRVPRNGSVLIVGSGLTMLDVVLHLRDLGARGTIHTVSRRGLLPQPHRSGEASPHSACWPAFTSVRQLVRTVRQAIRDHAFNGGDWRDVIDSLRARTQDLWRSLPVEEQRRFLRHVRPYWDTARHRVAPEIHDRIQEQIRLGMVRPVRGRVLGLSPEDDGTVRASLRPRTGHEFDLQVDAVVNCAGIEEDPVRSRSPLVANLLESGRALRHPTGLGFRAAIDGALIGAAGVPSARLFTLGSPRRGELWETTAIPEIRVQAAELAARLGALDRAGTKKESTVRRSALPANAPLSTHPALPS